MRAGLVVSATAHAAILMWGLLNLHASAPIDASDIEQIPVDFVEAGEETKIQKGAPTEKVVADVPAPPKPAPTPAPPPPPPPPVETPPLPTPEPATPPPAEEPAPQPEPAPAPEPEPQPAPTPTPQPEPPPPEPRKQVAAADIPVPKLSPSPPKPQPPKPKPPEEPKAQAEADPAQLMDRQKLEQTIASAEPSDAPPTVGSVNGSSQASLTANELDMLRARLVQCWNPPIGWTDPSEVRVVLMLDLQPDGTLAGQPQVLESPQGQFSLTAPESAMRAVRRCQPYNLPADKYDAWKEVKVTFDPKDMSGL